MQRDQTLVFWQKLRPYSAELGVERTMELVLKAGGAGGA